MIKSYHYLILSDLQIVCIKEVFNCWTFMCVICEAFFNDFLQFFVFHFNFEFSFEMNHDIFIWQTSLRECENNNTDWPNFCFENEKEQEIIYDYFYCCDETAVLSGLQKPLYQKTGSVKLLNYCVTCAYFAFKNSV